MLQYIHKNIIPMYANKLADTTYNLIELKYDELANIHNIIVKEYVKLTQQIEKMREEEYNTRRLMLIYNTCALQQFVYYDDIGALLLYHNNKKLKFEQ